MLEQLKFTLTDAKEFVVLNGLVVPKGSEVSIGLQTIELPSNEDVLKNFKMLFGIKKKMKSIEEEEPAVHDEESEIDSIEESDSNSEEEIEDDDD